MKVIEILKWEANKKAVALCYAESASDLVVAMSDGLQLSGGSIAYLGNGNVYVCDGSIWTQIGGE